MKPLIVADILKNLKTNTNIEGEWVDTEDNNGNGILKLKIGDENIQLIAVVLKENSAITLAQIFSRKGVNNSFIVIADRIFPKIKEIFKHENINYLDSAGNIFLKDESLYILIENNKSSIVSDKTNNRAFSKTGLRLVFDFLQNENSINETYRSLANTHGISIGNINYIISNLKQLGYVIEVDKNHLKLIEKEKLFKRWITAYDEKLKPSLLIGKFRFLKENDFIHWQKIVLKDKISQWGAEPAAEQLTNHLKPAILTLYTEESPNDLIKNYRLVPDPKGDVEVYKKFWKYDETNYNIVPPMLIYADLINTGNARNLETAEQIFKDVIKNRL